MGRLQGGFGVKKGLKKGEKGESLGRFFLNFSAAENAVTLAAVGRCDDWSSFEPSFTVFSISGSGRRLGVTGQDVV